MLKPAVSKAAADGSTGDVAPGYVEDAFEARTKLATGFSILLVEGKRNGRKREYEHRERNPSNHGSPPAERHVRVEHRRMAKTPDSCHECPKPPAWPAHESQHDQQRHHGKGDRALAGAP